MPTKRRGRPPLVDGDPSVNVHVRLPGKEYDTLYRRAQDTRMSVPERVRRDMREAMKKE